MVLVALLAAPQVRAEERKASSEGKVVQAQLETGTNGQPILSQLAYDEHLGGTTPGPCSLDAVEANVSSRFRGESRHIVDGTLGTTWVVKVKGSGPSERLAFTFESKRGLRPNSLGSAFTQRFWVFNGDTVNSSAWQQHMRVKKLEVYRNNKPMGSVELIDTPALQSFSLEGVVPTQSRNQEDVLTFEIVELYREGSVVSEAAVSEFVPICEYGSEKFATSDASDVSSATMVVASKSAAQPTQSAGSSGRGAEHPMTVWTRK
jgi:hypothetical protein